MRKTTNSLLLIFLLQIVLLQYSKAQNRSANFRLKSEEYSYKQGNEFVKTDSIYYNYPNPFLGDANGNDFSEYYGYYRDSANQVFDGYKTVFQYNANMKDTTRTYYYWNGTAWQLESKWVNQYNANGGLTNSSRYVANQGGLLENYRIFQTYNASGYAIERTERELITGNFVNKAQRVYGRDAAGNLTEFITKNWSNNTWENATRVVNTFQPSSTLVDTATRYDWTNNTWRPLSRDIYTYNSNGLITLQYQETYNTNTQIFGNYRRNESSYNASGKIALYSEYFWINGNWKLLTEVTFITYTGDFYGRATRKEFDSNTNQMENRFRWDNTFNQNGWLVKNRQFEWLNSAWEETAFTDYTFEEILISGVSKLAEANTLKAYPNPFHSNTILEFETPVSGITTIKIFSATGQLINEAKLNTSQGYNSWLWNGDDANGMALPQGMYVIQLHTANQINTLKLIKN
jgi:hypothetical protein